MSSDTPTSGSPTSGSPTSDTYTHGHHEAVLASHRARTAKNSAAYLLDHLSEGQRLLDVGCGPGTITADLAALVAPGEVVALDRDQAVVDEAVAVAHARGIDNVTAAVGDVYDLQYDDDSFDVVHAHQLLQHVSDPVRALTEMRRVVRPDGLVAARDADYGAMTWFPLDSRLDRWIEIYCSVARSNQAEPDAGRRLLSWANQIGFSEVTISASIWCYADDSTRQWWGGTWAQRMTTSAVAEQAVTKGFATTEELAGVAEAFQAWADHDDATFLVPNCEILARP